MTAIDFPSSPANNQTFSVGNKTFRYNSTKQAWLIDDVNIVVEGPQGVKGDKGNPGATGATGAGGVKGDKGDSGDLSSYSNTDVRDFLASGTLAGSIIPATNITYDLGSLSKQWRDIYVGPGSLYINGKKVISDESNTITIGTSFNQDLRLETSGNGDLELAPLGDGAVKIEGVLQIAAGKNITSIDGNEVRFGSGIAADSITSKTLNQNLTLSANGAGYVVVDDSLVISGNVTINGVTTTINTETIKLADNIIDLNSNFDTGTPTENAGIRVIRGDESNVVLRWNETLDRWEFTNDGAVYTPLFSGSYSDLTNKPQIPSSLTDLNITDGSAGQLLTTNGSGSFSFTSVEGLKGDKGDIGPAGDKGDKGDIGPAGDKGDKGDIGPAGIDGAPGDKGDIGPAGFDGIDGADGAPGDKGQKGEPGTGEGGGGTSLNWVVVSSSYSAEAGNALFADTTGGPFVITLPSDPTINDTIYIADNAGTWGDNNLTIDRNGSLIMGLNEDLLCNISNVGFALVFNGTSWRLI
jgi:hypothetical protein